MEALFDVFLGRRVECLCKGRRMVGVLNYAGVNELHGKFQVTLGRMPLWPVPPNSIKLLDTFETVIRQLPLELRKRVEALSSVPQRPDFHPEGNVYNHTKIVTERLILTGNTDLILAGVFHDIGKDETTVTNHKTGHPSAPGHEKVSASLVDKHAGDIYMLGGDPHRVYTIVKNHMRIKKFNQGLLRESKRKAIKRLEVYDDLQVFAQADLMLHPFEFRGHTLIAVKPLASAKEVP